MPNDHPWNRELGNTHFEELLEKARRARKKGLLRHNKPLLKMMLALLLKMLAGAQLSAAKLVVVTKPITQKVFLIKDGVL